MYTLKMLELLQTILLRSVHQLKVLETLSSSAPVGAMKDDVGLGWPSGMRASGTHSDSDGAAAGQPCPAERSEASRRQSS